MSEGHQGRDAFVHALLQEELGSEPRPASADELLQRLELGDGARAFARAAGQAPARQRSWIARRWPLVAAAVAVVAVGATFAQDWFGGNAPSDDEVERPEVPNDQDPQPEDRTVRIRDLAHFEQLVPQIRGVSVEVLRLHDANLPFEVEVKGHPVGMTQHACEPFVAALADDLALLEPAAAEWQNQLTFELKDGRSIEGAIYPYGGAGVLRVHLQGLKGDLGVGGLAGNMLRDLLKDGVFQACYQRGIVTRGRPLKEVPRDANALRIFQHSDEDLRLLAEFSRLTKLDVSGLRNTLGEVGHGAIAKACPQLEELVLDGAMLPDTTLRVLGDLTKLKRLSLRGVRGFAGTGFEHYTHSQKHRDGPTEVDLSYCKSLSDAGLRAICAWDPEVLRLQGAGAGITRRGFEALQKTRRLRELDLRSFSMKDKGMLPVLNALLRREGLKVLR
jgi:hypothetical protein